MHAATTIVMYHTMRSGVVLVCLALAFTGCSSGPQPAVEQPSASVSATAEPEPSEVDRHPGGTGVGGHEGSGWNDEDWPRPPLAGMYVGHPEDLGQTEKWLHAVLSIEPPCAFLTNVSYLADVLYSANVLEELGYDSLANWEGRRLALSLPFPQMRLDENDQTLWMLWPIRPKQWSYDIPIAHGDRVIASPSVIFDTIEGKKPHELHLFWDACPAHALARPEGLLTSVEWLCSNKPPQWVWHEGQELERICVEDTRPWNQRYLLEQQGIAPVGEPPVVDLDPGEPPPVAELPLPPLHGAYPYHPDMELELDKLVGILSIEPVPKTYFSERECVYLYPTAASAQQTLLWGDAWKYTGPDGRPLAVRLDLPYPQVRFDEDTWTLWNSDIGPMTTGDRVIVDPVAPPDFNTTLSQARHKEAHETLRNVCGKANARATVLDIQPVEHYCTHSPPARHQSQCEHAMRLRHQPEYQLALPE